VIAYTDGEVRQQFNICFTGRVIGGQLAESAESTALRFVAADELDSMPIHPTQRLRLGHFLTRSGTPYCG
jgi:hypothetical protein